MGDPVEVVPAVSSVPPAKITSTEEEPIVPKSEGPVVKETVTSTTITSASSITTTVDTTKVQDAIISSTTTGTESVAVEATVTTTATTSSTEQPAGATSEADKKISRAQRFGIVTSAKEIAASAAAKKSATSEVDAQLAEKLKSRAQKFGVISPILMQEEAAKLKQEQACDFHYWLHCYYNLLFLIVRIH